MAETSEDRRPSGATRAADEAAETAAEGAGDAAGAGDADEKDAAPAKDPPAAKEAAPKDPPKSSAHFPTSTGVPAERADATKAFDALTKNARLSDVVALTRRALAPCVEARALEGVGARAREIAEELGLPRADLDTPFGNVLTALEGPDGETERALCRALYAHVLAESPKKTREEEDRLVADALWLAAATPFDALELVDRALGDEAAELWIAFADRARRTDAGRGGATTRAEAVLACAALVMSESPGAREQARKLAGLVRDPAMRRVLEGGVEDTPTLRLEGTLAAPPRGPVATTILGLTGLLFVIHAGRALARLALGYQRPAEVSFDKDGARIQSKTIMLGRTLRESDERVPRASVMRVGREVLYPRLAFYAGLFALALGSWVGVRTLSDGVRGASPSLLLAGLVIVVLGVAIDFALASLVPSARGRARITLVPKSGRSICVVDVDRARADEILARAFKG